MAEHPAEEIEKIERVRQQIMRLRELLNLLAGQLQEADRDYHALFSHFSAETIANTREKDLQWQAAEQLLAVGDLTPLSKVAIQMRFNARNMERDFEQLYDLIASVESD